MRDRPDKDILKGQSKTRQSSVTYFLSIDKKQSLFPLNSIFRDFYEENFCVKINSKPDRFRRIEGWDKGSWATYEQWYHTSKISHFLMFYLGMREQNIASNVCDVNYMGTNEPWVLLDFTFL